MTIEDIKNKAKQDFDSAYMNGYDSIINGSNLRNCHFSNFSTPAKTKRWEEGREAAKKSLNTLK